MDFAAAIGKFALKSEDRLKRVATGAALELARAVVMATPVDTGRARGNWVCEVGGDAGGRETGRLDKDGDATLRAIAEALEGYKAGDRISVANSLPYIIALEYGSSAQAPNGMLRLAAQRFQDIIRREAARL